MSMESFELNVLKRKQLYDLTFKNENNKKGIIYNLTSVLFVHGWNIIQASAKTNNQGIVEDSFLIEPMEETSFTDEVLKKINIDLAKLLEGDLTVLEYLDSKPHALEQLEGLREKRNIAQITVSPKDNSLQTVVTIQAGDRPGLLFEISQVLYLLNLDIVNFKASYDDDGIFDTVYIQKENSQTQMSQREELELRSLLFELFSTT